MRQACLFALLGSLLAEYCCPDLGEVPPDVT
jgi:hypothetical protein